jgi:hypothetical protein
MSRVCSTDVEKGTAYRILVKEPVRKSALEDIGVGGKLLLKWIFEK